MKKINLGRKVDAALYLSIMGVFAAFPFQDTFWGGALFAVFRAAAIGGLADSFAVSALFGDPLRIKWPNFMGTRIIAKRKQQLINELVNMVNDELLTVPAISARLAEYNIANVLLLYVKQRGGEAELNEILQRFAADILTNVKLAELANAIQTHAVASIKTVQVADLVAEIGEWTLKNGYDDSIIEFVLSELTRLIKSEAFAVQVEQLVASALRSYEAGNGRRKAVNFVAGIQAAKITESVLRWLDSFLEKLAHPAHPVRQDFKRQLATYAQRVKTDATLRAKIESGKIAIIEAVANQFRLDTYLYELLEPLQQVASASTNERHITAFPWIKEQTARFVTSMEQNPAMLAKADASIKTAILGLIAQKQSAIGRLVAEQLHAYKDEELIRMVKDKAGHDLQYVRLNGIGVGAIIGLLLYVATVWIGG